MNVRLEPSWHRLLAAEFEKPYFAALAAFVRAEYAAHTCYPPAGKIFSAFDLCPVDNVKVVIIGQDPYHGPGQAEGLCFSVAEGVKHPPSLVNIFQEISADTGGGYPESGSLRRWAEQGVLLLNATLTVREHEAASHAGHGWETFTDAAIAALSGVREGLVYMLWGSYAQRKAAHVDPTRNLLLRAPHPSPLSAYRGFFGSHHFTLANDYLRAQGVAPIAW